jgi:hypothetical protein
VVARRNTKAVMTIMKVVRSWMSETAEVYLICWICLFGSSCGAAESKSLDCAIPLWTAEVIGNFSAARSVASADLIDSNRAGITFLDKERLIVHEVVLDPSHLSSRQSSDSSQFRLRVSVLDVASGKSTAAIDLGTRVHESSIQNTSGGALVRSGETLRLFSRDFVQEKELTLPHSEDTYTVTVSASGKNILINRHDEHSSHFEVLDGGTLQVRQEWIETPPLRRLYSSSDDSIAAADLNQEHILLSEFGSERWRVIGGKAKLACIGLPTFVTDSALVNACKEFSYISSDGSLIFQDSFSKGEALVRKIAVSQDGETVAVSLDRSKGSDFWDTGKGIKLLATHVLVYDLPLKKRSFTVEVNPPPKSDYDFALSPDGSRLAILSDRRVTMCSVPMDED